MLEAVIHHPTAETGVGRQDALFAELVNEKLKSPYAVYFEFVRLPPSLHNYEERYARIAILNGEKDLRSAVIAQRPKYNPEIMPDNSIECFIADDSRKTLTRLRLNNIDDESLSVTKTKNFPYSTPRWEPGDIFNTLLYKALTDTQEFEDIGLEIVPDGEKIDVLLDTIRRARIDPELTQETIQSWPKSRISRKPVSISRFPVNVLGGRPDFVRVTV